VKIEEEGLDIPVICRHCDKAPCMEACPEGAIIRDSKTNAVIILQEKCMGCRACISACPFGAILVDPKTGEVRKCDLCDGNARCAYVCPEGAIIFFRKDVGPRIIMRSLTEKSSKSLVKERRTLLKNKDS